MLSEPPFHPGSVRATRAVRLLAALPAAMLAVCASVAAVAAPQAEVLQDRLDHPWGLSFLPGGRFIVTERPGRMRILSAEGAAGEPLAGLPPVAASGQGGLLDVLVDRDFERNRRLYFCYSEPGGEAGTNGTALARATLSADERSLGDLKVLFSQQPKVRSTAHFGCRIVDKGDGTLFLTLGERFIRKEDAQKLDNHLGKIVRIGKDGAVPKDNPFVGRAGALPEIWSYGHRNAQGAVIGPDGRLWMHEHGPQGGDEINLPQPGRNYGWPVITYGENYGGGKIGEGITRKDGMEQPVHYWVPSIAPSGMAFVTSDRYPAWKGDLMVGSLKFGYLDRIELDGTRVRAEHKLLENLQARIRDVKQGPDGWLYLLTDEEQGKLLRLRAD